MTEPEASELYRRVRERSSHYRRLGFTGDDIVNGRLPLDDQLWEKVKDRPIDPNNEYDHILKALGKLGPVKNLGRQELEEAFRKAFGGIFKPNRCTESDLI